MTIDLSDQIIRAQIAFALGVIALTLVYAVFGRRAYNNQQQARK